MCRVLQFLFTEINYGGRVTDDKDRRLMSNLITTFCGPQVLEEGYAFSPSGTYTIPSCETVAQVSGVHTSWSLRAGPAGGLACSDACGMAIVARVKAGYGACCHKCQDSFR